jgi:hypothetical protein
MAYGVNIYLTHIYNIHFKHFSVWLIFNETKIIFMEEVLEKMIVAQLAKKFSNFLEPEGSLSRSQQPVTYS